MIAAELISETEIFIENNKIDVANLPTFDIEYMFLQIRAKSVGEVSKIKVLCPDDKKTYTDVEVDLTKVNVEMDETHNPKIELTSNIGMLMSYPTLNLIGVHAIHMGKDAKDNASGMFELVADCMYQIWEGEEVHDCADYSDKEKIEFLESLNHEQFEKLNSFFETMPTLKHDITITNPNTNVTSTITLKGIQNFFE